MDQDTGLGDGWRGSLLDGDGHNTGVAQRSGGGSTAARCFPYLPDPAAVPDEPATFPLVSIGYTNTAPMATTAITIMTITPAIRVFLPGIRLPRGFRAGAQHATAQRLLAQGQRASSAIRCYQGNLSFSGLRAVCGGAVAGSVSSSHASDCWRGASTGIVRDDPEGARLEGTGGDAGAADCREAGCGGTATGTTTGEPHLLQNAESPETLFPQRVQNTTTSPTGEGAKGDRTDCHLRLCRDRIFGETGFRDLVYRVDTIGGLLLLDPLRSLSREGCCRFCRALRTDRLPVSLSGSPVQRMSICSRGSTGPIRPVPWSRLSTRRR